MKQTYIIIGASSLVLILIFIWVYLLIYGTPKLVENFFTDFSFSGSSENISDLPFIPPVEEPLVDVTDKTPLRQLTTRPIIGFGEKNENDQAFIIYAEAGTGHVYQINLLSGVEIRLSNITILNAQLAKFSPSGQYAAIRSGYGNQNSIELVILTTENNATKETLTQKMVDFTFNDQNELQYSEYNQNGLLGRLLNTESKLSKTIFSVPFQSATVVWGKNKNSSNYVYPKASTKLAGYLYSLAGGTIKRLDISGNGLTVVSGGDYVVFTKNIGNEILSRSLNTTTNTSIAVPIVAEPSKCIIENKSSAMYCGNDRGNYDYSFPDDWYQGIKTFNDRIYKTDLKRGSSVQLVNPEEVTGRQIDVMNMDISQNGEVLYFTNKNDNTLWMYEI